MAPGWFPWAHLVGLRLYQAQHCTEYSALQLWLNCSRRIHRTAKVGACIYSGAGAVDQVIQLDYTCRVFDTHWLHISNLGDIIMNHP